MWNDLELKKVQQWFYEAYLLGYPTVDMYNILKQYALDKQSPEYRAQINEIFHVRQVATPADKAIVAPNCDTPYSTAWVDLRAEPLVLIVPSFEADRYVSATIFDLYSNIVECISPRTNGREGGKFLLVFQDWQNEMPMGITKVIKVPTQLAFILIRTQLKNQADLNRVHLIQDQFQLMTWSQYLGQPPKATNPLAKKIAGLNLRQESLSLRFFEILNWMWQYMPILPEDHQLRTNLQEVGVGAGLTLQLESEEKKQVAMVAMTQAHQAMQAKLAMIKSSAELFGSREFYHGDYLMRAVGAMVGIFGNSGEEYLGPGYKHDNEGQPFDGRHRYEIRFEAGKLPPVSAFWSITVYDELMLLYANELNRYVINSAMLGTLNKDEDGSLTIYVQHDNPGGAKTANWLPVPAGKFTLTLRCYQPKPELIDGSYQVKLPVKVDE